MPTLTFPQALSYAYGAGFQGQSAYIITAIAMAESGLNTQAQNCNNPGGTCDRGIMQINNHYHSEVSDACAYDPACAFKAAFTISSGGTSFRPWCTAWSDGACGSKGGTYLGSGAPYQQYIQSNAGVQPTPLANLQQATSTNAAGCKPWDIGCMMSNLGLAVHDVLVRIGLFIVALVLVMLGGIILIHPDPAGLAKRAAGAFL